MEVSPTDVARRLLERIRRQEPAQSPLRTLASLNEDDLSELRTNRHGALAFWLNVYNAATQILLDERPDLFDSRWQFFRTTAITVADTGMSLDDIEHGILRDGRSKYGFGYLPRLSRSGFSADYRLAVDPRIHFALNCGAESCPAILAYEPETVDRVLDDATQAYLQRTVTYDADRNRVRVPRVCLWFVGDFGGLSGIRSFLQEYELIPPHSKPRVRFDTYDWTKAPRRFADEIKY